MSSKKKKAVIPSDVKGNKAISFGKANPDSFYDKHPVWSFSKCDLEHKKWGVLCGVGSLDGMILYLRQLETMKWKEILMSNSGRSNNTRNHAIKVSSIINDAQKRLRELNLDDRDELYSIAISNTERVWGILDEGIFSIVWFDRNHEICPSQKRNT